MPPFPQSLIHPFEVASSAPIFPRTAAEASPPRNPLQPLMLYALITASIFTVLIIFGFVSLAFCDLHYRTRMGAPHSDRGRVADLESGYFDNNRGYGTTSEYDSREDETSTLAESKDHRDTVSVLS